MLLKKVLSEMDRKHFWLSPNRSVGYEQPVTNQVRNDDNDEVYLSLDKKKVKLVTLVVKLIKLLAKSPKFEKERKKLH